ncbi:hypothetical protein ACRYCC_33310 [Actinomadura scrupuli]|uniref:hypothetical protein n=1 Tax=Actinomadura scrupuli TaxID=559629 RepID=UPI003D95E042
MYPPITDPTIPERDRRLLVRYPRVLIPASFPPPPVRSLADRLYGRAAGPWADVFLSLAQTAAWFEGPEVKAARAARFYHRRYVLPSDLDRKGQQLVVRARAAVRTVLESEVSRHGMLDTIANHVIFPQQIWEIAWMAHQQTVLRAEQRTVSRSEMTAVLAAVVGPQREAIERSAAEIGRRVELLEQYAQRVRAADSALVAQRMMARNDRYRDLLAQTHDRQGIQGLADEAGRMADQLESSVHAAVEAGQALALPRDPQF